MILLVVLSVLTVILTLRLRLFVSLGSVETECTLGIMLFRIPLSRKKKSTKGTTTGKKELADIIRAVLKASVKLRKRIIIEKLKISCVEADPDPYNAVMRYNMINTVLGSALPLVEKAFSIKKKEIYTDIDMSAGGPQRALELGISVRVYELLHPGLHIGLAVLKAMKGRYYGKQAE